MILIIIGCGYTRELNNFYCLLSVSKQVWINTISNYDYSITAMM